MADEIGELDLTAQANAAKVASNYITDIDNGGIFVAPAGEGPNDTQTPTGWSIKDALELIKSGISTFKVWLDDDENTANILVGESNKSHLEMDYHSIKLVSGLAAYMHISDLRDMSGTAKVKNAFFSDGGSDYTLDFEYYSDDTHASELKVDGVVVTDYTISADYIGGFSGATIYTTSKITIVPAPVEGAFIEFDYYTKSFHAKAYTLGTRNRSATIGAFSLATGYETSATRIAAHAEGYSTTAGGRFAHSEGHKTSALGTTAHAEGYDTCADGEHSHSEGNKTIASDASAHAEGYDTKAFGAYSHAEGAHTTVEGLYSHAEGWGNVASGERAHAEGGGSNNSGSIHYGPANTAGGDMSHAEGGGVTASGEASHAEGRYTTAGGANTHAQNLGTIASKNSQTSIGTYNVEDDSASTTHPSNTPYFGTHALIIGNGTSNNARSNALTVGWDGNIMAQAMAGIIQMFAGSTAPTGWLECDGSAVSRTTYATLFAAIGTTWGAGDGSTTFNLPDLRGRGPIGEGAGSGLTSRTLGGTGGSEHIQSHTHGFTNPKIPNHVHTMGHTHPTGSGKNRLIGYLYDANGSGGVSTGVTKVRVTAASSGTNYVPRVANADVDFSGVANTGSSSAANTGNPTSLDATTGGAVGAVSGASTGSSGNMQPFAVVKFIICTGKTS